MNNFGLRIESIFNKYLKKIYPENRRDDCSSEDLEKHFDAGVEACKTAFPWVGCVVQICSDEWYSWDGRMWVEMDVEDQIEWTKKT